MSSPAKLTDTQRTILFEASQRKDRCLIPPKTLKAAVAQKVATKLLKAGLVSEIKAKSGMEAWRRDEETGSQFASPSFISAANHSIARRAQPNGQWSRASNRLRCRNGTAVQAR